MGWVNTGLVLTGRLQERREENVDTNRPIPELWLEEGHDKLTASDGWEPGLISCPYTEKL
jgi:hypothetical protein